MNREYIARQLPGFRVDARGSSLEDFVFFGDFSANIAMDQDYESTSNAPTAGEHPVALCHAGCALLMSWGSSLSGRVW
jgi:hypothetical protein